MEVKLAPSAATMKRPGLTTQLFLAVLATAMVVALAVGAAAQWSFHRGFIGYLNDQAAQRMEAAVPRLVQAFAEHGTWDFVRDRPDVWFGLVGVERLSLPGKPDEQAQAGREMLASDLLGAGRRMTLLDAQRQRVIGYPQILASSDQREIVVAGRTAGWLAIAPVETVTDAAAVHFLDQQLQTNLVVGLVALLLAAWIAWWVARNLLSPVREVAQATHRLASGDHGTRVAVKGGDEVARLAQDFNQLALTLQRNEQVRREYMADVSHELRTPLAVLKGQLEAIEDGVYQATPERIQALQAEVATLAQLVSDLHELALADVGALTYRKVETDLRALVEQECILACDACAARQQTLEADVPAAPLWLQADPARLRQLLHNLLGNAVRYTDVGGQVQLRLRQEQAHAVIDVCDSAPGVPDALLPRLFERFFRVEGSRGRAGGGSGLGLAICRSIVQAHGGQVEARHAALGGVWIQVRLPLTSLPLPPASPVSPPST